MMVLLQWSYFIVGPLLSSYAALYIWSKHKTFGYALTAGTLVGVIFTLGVSMLFWGGTDVCEQCYLQAE